MTMRRITKLLAVIVCVFCLSVPAKAQDIHLAQYYFSPLQLNPAETGFFRNGIYRVSANVRNQWSFVNLPYTTYSAGFEAKILQGIMSHNDVFAGGIYMSSDQAGKGGLKRTAVKGSLAFHKDFYEGLNTVIVGIQGGLVQYGFDPNILVFGDQIEDGTSDQKGSSRDIANFDKTKINYVDINAGILWNFIPTDELQIYAGLTMFHINDPALSFMNEGWYLSRFMSLYAGAAAVMNDQFDILPSFIYYGQHGNNELFLGSALRYNSNENTGIRFGSWFRRAWRNTDGLTLMVGLDFNTLKAGLSYDINLGKLTSASRGNGAFELAATYVFGKSRHGAGTVKCPRF